MEGGLVDRRNGSISGKIMKKKKCLGLKKKTLTTLQRLFESCRHSFKGPGTVPSSQDVHKISSILDSMKPEDVGLSKDMPFFRPRIAVQGAPRITYTTIYKSDKFSLCIFFLPPNAVIPLHNHPGMTVFSKLLLGKIHIKAYDWVDPSDSRDSEPSSEPRLAKLKADRLFTAPCDTSVLYPTSGGNIHAFTAITPCAMLDVLGPPYSKEDGRDCSYYKALPYAAFSNGKREVGEEEEEGYGWLEEIEAPNDSQMNGIWYMGPPVVRRV